ncbi:MAG: hypothetical protein AB8I08_22405 [Sandaracinaceae bacterium]
MTVQHPLRVLSSLTVLLSLTLVGCDDGTMSPMSDSGPMTDGGAVEPHTGDLTMGRLLVADHAGANAWLYDLDGEEPALLETYSLDAPGRAYADLHGRYAYLVQRDANRVQVLESGILFESHVDHYHISERAPAMLDLALTGSGPTHFVPHGGWVASFYDGSGDVDVLQERTISAGMPTVQTVSTGPAHHGVAVVASGHVLATIGTEGEALPSEVGIWRVGELDGAAVATAGPCPGLHGEGASEGVVAFGCTDGVLLLQYDEDHFDPVKIDNPSGTAEGTRVGTLVGHEELPVLIGNWGSEGLAIVDPVAQSITPVLTSAPVVSFALDMHGEHLFALTADGMLHRLVPTDGSANGEPMQVTEEIDLMGGHGAARPALTPGAGRMYLALPESGEVVELHAERWEVERRIAIAGVPHSLAVVSASPDWHEDGNEHDDHDDHD